MANSSAFRTFQTPQNYEDALARHGQWIRWVSGVTCPCLNSNTMQPDPSCSLCRGRGRIYRSPGRFNFLDEIVKHDSQGRVYPSKVPIVSGSAFVSHQGTALTLSGTQPADLSYIQLASPYPKAWQRLKANYEWNPNVAVVSENSEDRKSVV